MSVIIVPPMIDWHWMKHRPQHLMSELARRGHTIYYCNKTQQHGKCEQETEPNVYIVHDHERWVEQWRTKRNKLNVPVGVWCTMPTWARRLKTLYDPDWIIYDCAEQLAEWSFFERDMLNVADAFVCCSEWLFQKWKRMGGNKAVMLIRNACNPMPGLHKACHGSKKTGARIGFVGAWAPWVNDRIIRRLALIKDAEFIVVGPEFRKKYTQSSYGKINYVGFKQHHELPEYMSSFDVCIIPFRITPLTVAANPVKAYEYLASGKPVVATALPELQLMHPWIDIARTDDDFVRKVIYRMHHPGDSASRIAFALNHTWQHRGDQAVDLIEQVENKIFSHKVTSR